MLPLASSCYFGAKWCLGSLLSADDLTVSFKELLQLTSTVTTLTLCGLQGVMFYPFFSFIFCLKKTSPLSPSVLKNAQFRSVGYNKIGFTNTMSTSNSITFISNNTNVLQKSWYHKINPFPPPSSFFDCILIAESSNTNP